MERLIRTSVLSAFVVVFGGFASCSSVNTGGDGNGDNGEAATAGGGTGTTERSSDACTLTGKDPSQIGGSGDSCFSAPESSADITVEVYESKSDFMSALEGCGQTITFEDVDVCTSDVVEIELDRYVPSFGLRIGSNKTPWVDTDFGFSDDYKPVSGERMIAAGNPQNESSDASKINLTFPGVGNDDRVAGVGGYFIDADFPSYQQSSFSVADGRGNTLKSKDVTTESGKAKFVGMVAVDGSGNPVAAIGEATLVLGSGWPGSGSNEGVTADDVVVSTK